MSTVRGNESTFEQATIQRLQLLGYECWVIAWNLLVSMLPRTGSAGLRCQAW